MTVITMLLEMTRGVLVTAAVIALARVVLKRVLSPKAKYYLWLLLLVRMMLPVLPESPLSLMNYLPAGQSAEPAAPAVQTVEDVADYATAGDPVWWEHEPIAVPAAPEAPKAPALTVETPQSSTDTMVWEAPAAPQAPEIPVTTVLLWIWLGGMGVVLLVYLALYAITARQLRHFPFVTDSETLRVFLALKRTLGIQGKVNLVSGGGGMLGGILRPTIVLPAERHGQDVAPILVHELMHYKYKDLWLSLLFRLMAAVHWFNPVVWLCFHRMRLDCESACDQRVLESGLVQPSSYATLLYEEGVLQMKNGLLMHTTFGGDRHSLRRRIRLIAQFQRPKVWTTVLAVVLALVVTACTLTDASSKSDIREAIAGAWTTQAALGSYTSPTLGTADLTESELQSQIDAYNQAIDRYFSADSATQNDKALHAQYLRETYRDPTQADYTLETRPICCDIKQLQVSGDTAKATAQVVLYTNTVRHSTEAGSTGFYVNCSATEVTLPFELKREDGLWKVRDVTISGEPWNSIWQADISGTYFDSFNQALAAARTVDLSSLEELTQHWNTALPELLPLPNNLTSTVGSQAAFDAYMQSYEPPGGVFGLTYEEHVDQGLLDPDQGTLEHYTYEDTDMTYSIFTTSMELGGETVEIAYSFGQNVLSEEETLKQVFVTPPEDVPIGTWLEQISDPWLSSMTQNTDLNGWEWNTREYVADFLTEEQLAQVVEAEVAMAETTQSSEFPKTRDDAEHLLKTQWRVVSGFYIGESNLWQFNGTGAALIRAAQAETAGDPAKADVLPEGMDMDAYIEAIQPGFGHYGWTFQEHVDAGLLSEASGTWNDQTGNSSEFVTTIELNGMTLEAEFIFSHTMFNWDTDAPQVLTEIRVHIPTAVKDGIQWGLELMEPWADYMTLGGNDSQANFCATPVRAGTHLSETQRQLAADKMYETRYVMNPEDAYTELDNWYIAGGWYMAGDGVWQFNGTGAALYLTRPNPQATDGMESSVATGSGTASESFNGAEIFAAYAPYGLTYDATKDELWYNGELVRWFEDYYPLADGEQAGIDFLNENGVVDVHGVRDFSKLEKNPDGSTDPSGKLTGVEAFSAEEFASRDIQALKGSLEQTAVEVGSLSAEELQDMLAEYAPFGITYDAKQDQWYYNGEKVCSFLDILLSNGEIPNGGKFQGTIRSFSGEGTVELETVRDYENLNADGYGTLTGIKVNGALQAVTPSAYVRSRDSITYSNTQWGMTPEELLAAEGLDPAQWTLNNRGKNYYMSGTIPGHPEVEEAEFEFHFTGLDLSLGLDYVEVDYDQNVIRYEDLLALRKEQLGPPTSTQGDTSSWDLKNVGLTLTLTTNGFLREMLNNRDAIYDPEELLASFDAEEYLSTLQPPNGHYGWTYDQHVEAGLLDPDSGTLTLEQDTEAGRAHSFTTQIELGGETVEAVYVFSTTLATVDGSEKEVLTQVVVTPPEGVALSKWIASFSDSFTDKLFESSSLQYKTPIAVGGLLSEETTQSLLQTARDHGYGSMSLSGWSLVVNWYQQETRIWHFNGTGAALYLTAMETD